MLPPVNYISVAYSSYMLLIKLCYCKYNGSGIKKQRDYLNRSLTDDQWIKRISDARETTKSGSPSKMTVLSQKRKDETKGETPFIGTVQWLKDKLAGKVETAKEMNFVGSRDSNKYHLPSCGWAERIPSEDRIYFPSPEAAKSRGYKPCRVCRPNRGRKRV
jgi:hypothetical protein